MAKTLEYDVVVAGCGPVGVVAAHLLGHYGISTLVIEKERLPYERPRAVHIDHEIMRVFQSVGLAELLLPQLSMPAGAMHFGADRSVIRQFQKIVQTDRLGWASDYFFYQPELEKTLRQQLPKYDCVACKWDHSVTAINQDAASVLVTAESGAETLLVHTRYLLGCDGGRSTVRRLAGIELSDLGFDEPWIVVDALVDGPITMPELHGVPAGVNLQEVVFIIGDPNRPTSVIPGVGRHRRWEFMMLPGETAEDFAAANRVKSLLQPWVLGRHYEVIRSAVYRFHALLAQQWQIGRIFLLGDAAHQTPPFFGQGLCHGIRDAANLVWKLKLVSDESASPNILGSYQVERLPQVRGVIEASVRTGKYICTLDPQAARRRDAEMRGVAAKTPPAYVDIIPPLAAGILDVKSTTPSPIGGRFIQPPMVSVAGERQLLDTLTNGGFVMLVDAALPVTDTGREGATISRVAISIFRVFRHGAPDTRSGTDLLDCTGEIYRWFEHYRCRGVLLRPDAYVYGICSTSQEAIDLSDTLRDQLASGQFLQHLPAAPLESLAVRGQAKGWDVP